MNKTPKITFELVSLNSLAQFGFKIKKNRVEITVESDMKIYEFIQLELPDIIEFEQFPRGQIRIMPNLIGLYVSNEFKLENKLFYEKSFAQNKVVNGSKIYVSVDNEWKINGPREKSAGCGIGIYRFINAFDRTKSFCFSIPLLANIKDFEKRAKNELIEITTGINPIFLSNYFLTNKNDPNSELGFTFDPFVCKLMDKNFIFGKISATYRYMYHSNNSKEKKMKNEKDKVIKNKFEKEKKEKKEEPIKEKKEKKEKKEEEEITMTFDFKNIKTYRMIINDLECDDDIINIYVVNDPQKLKTIVQSPFRLKIVNWIDENSFFYAKIDKTTTFTKFLYSNLVEIRKILGKVTRNTVVEFRKKHKLNPIPKTVDKENVRMFTNRKNIFRGIYFGEGETESFRLWPLILTFPFKDSDSYIYIGANEDLFQQHADKIIETAKRIIRKGGKLEDYDKKEPYAII